jgi:alkylation response protein AidB-like acyl-CoA dehydrogenase
MNYGWTAENVALRQEVRNFIAENITPDVLDELRLSGEANRGPSEQVRYISPLAAEVHKKIAEKGWIGISWPKEYGGQGGSRLDQYIVEEELARVGIRAGGAGGVGSAILGAGTEEQKHSFLTGMLEGQVFFASGFTEPSGGADLASLQCRAIKDGDFYIINGQKIFTSGAEAATHVYLLVRTDPDAPKHRGISILLVPMNSPGITVRPLWTVQNDPPAPPGTTYGTPRTNETFYDNVRVPASALLGEENMGWYVNAARLNLDRVGATRYLISVQRDEDIVNWARENRVDGYLIADDPAIRDKMAELWIEAQVCRLMTMRSMSIVERDGDFTYEGSAEKVWSPEHGVKTTEAIAQMLGPYGQLLNGSPRAIESGIFAHNLMGAYQSGINHGSVQIMRDQVAVRGLGLPRG